MRIINIRSLLVCLVLFIFSNMSQAARCPAPPGSYCPINTANVLPCPAGQYSTQKGVNVCSTWQLGRIARQGQQYTFRVQQERTVSKAGPSQHQPAERVRQIRIAQQVLNYAINVWQVRLVRRGRAFALNTIRTMKAYFAQSLGFGWIFFISLEVLIRSRWELALFFVGAATSGKDF